MPPFFALIVLFIGSALHGSAGDSLRTLGTVNQGIRDICYKETAEGAQLLDLYYPQGQAIPAGGFPTVLYTHGGGWSKGNKEIGPGPKQMMVDALTADGFAVASINYRLCTKDGRITIRECVTDSFDALRYLSLHARRLNLNTQQFLTWGDSAGGHLAQMLCLAPEELFPGDPELADASWEIIGSVSWYGPCDFEKSELFNRPDGTGSAGRFMNRLLRGGESPQERLATIRELSPVNYLRPDMPPLLMLQGDADPTIPVHHAHYMAERAAAIQAPVHKLIVANASHGWKHRGKAPMSLSLEQIIEQTVAFMRTHKRSAENVINP